MVLTDAELLAFSGSVIVELQLAVSVIVAAAVGWTMMVAVVCWPLPKLPRLGKVTSWPATV